MQPGLDYIGDELQLFQQAVNWKKYFSSFFKPFIKGSVAEVGAGMGANVPYLLNSSVTSYCCIEPDGNLVAAINHKIASGELPTICKVKQGFLEENLNGEFDTIIYIDVLEHIEDDVSEVKKAVKALKPGGYICILVPANPNDYTAFDKAIGHFRRYTRSSLLQTVAAESLQIEWCRYLDSIGSMASKANKLFLKQSQPTKSQILLWDRFMIPVSKIIDRPMGFSHGKSLLLVAKKLPS